MSLTERRNQILKALCRRRSDTITNLANEFGVSNRTIRRDIEYLSHFEPIYTQSGRYGGGVYVEENYYMDKMYFDEPTLVVMRKILNTIENMDDDLFSAKEIKIIETVIEEYTKPNHKIK